MIRLRRQRTLALAAFVAGLAVAMPVALRAQTHAGQYDEADIEYGAQLFSQRCQTCHGERGDLMPQANLRAGVFRNATSDRELTGVIANGLPGTAMVPTGYSDSELTALVAYLRNITTFDPSGAAIGDAASGKLLYDGAGRCGACHSIGSGGPRYAPALSRIGSIRTPAVLRRALSDPQGGLLPINRPVTAVTAGGDVIRGRRLNEDTFNVQLITVDGSLASLDKTTLKSLTIGTESAMPDYGEQFTDSEIADLVAYLLTLKGAPE